MAFKKTLAQRIINAYKITRPSLSISSSSIASANRDKKGPDLGDNGIFRRFLHRNSIYQSLEKSPGLRSLPTGEKLIEKLREMDIVRDRIRLDGLRPPQLQQPPPEAEEGKLTVADARKLLRLAQLEMVKSRIIEMKKNCITHSEFVQICSEACSDVDQGLEFAKMLDQSGTVIVLGNVVFLRPDQVVKTMQGLMQMQSMMMTNPNEPQMIKELQKLEEQKSVIDKKAESLVRRELWCGLGFLVIQTAAFMRLTFWELTWDVMEPICFFVTSMYCMGGYGFFLRTSKEPSFEGFYQSRFSSKQKRLMKVHNFNLDRYNELRRTCSSNTEL